MLSVSYQLKHTPIQYSWNVHLSFSGLLHKLPKLFTVSVIWSQGPEHRLGCPWSRFSIIPTALVSQHLDACCSVYLQTKCLVGVPYGDISHAILISDREIQYSWKKYNISLTANIFEQLSDPIKNIILLQFDMKSYIVFSP